MGGWDVFDREADFAVGHAPDCLDYTLPEYRAQYTLPDDSADYTLPERRAQYTIKGDDP
jgi:hypothetical protein